MDSEETATGLPASFEMVWGVRDRPKKGPKRGLSLEQVVEAGITVATAEGIGGVSMSRVASELGTSAMSLYRYVGSKDELLALMIDGAFDTVEVVEPTEGTWRERLARWAELELAAYRRFPWVMRIPVSGPPVMPNQMRFLEWGLRALGGTSLEEGEKLSVVLLVTSFTRSFAMLSSDLAEAYEAGAPNALANGYGELIRKLMPVDEYPALHAVVDAGVFDEENDDIGDFDYDFHFGLARILDGVEALVQARP